LFVVVFVSVLTCLFGDVLTGLGVGLCCIVGLVGVLVVVCCFVVWGLVCCGGVGSVRLGVG